MKFVRAYFGPLIVLVLLCTNAVLYSVVFADGQRNLVVAFLDVGQGDSIYIEAPNGNQILIDGGPNSAVVRELSKVMPFYDRSIDVLVATHPDKDHIAGLIDVISSYEIGSLLEPGVISDTGASKTLDAIAREQNIARVQARRGMRIDLGDGVYADILFPDRDVARIETNTGSIILRVVYGETEFMLTGDSPKSIERYLVGKDGGNLESDVLKAGHHGSKTSSSEEFVSTVNPEYVVISAGKDSQYGHPHKEVIDLFEKSNIKILSTAESSTIIFISDGKTISTH